jgi:hypothetical protein
MLKESVVRTGMAYLDPDHPGFGAKATPNPVDRSTVGIGGAEFPRGYIGTGRLVSHPREQVSRGTTPAAKTRLPRFAQVLPVLRRRRWLVTALCLVVGLELVLLLISLVPDTIWASHGWPQGPIPSSLYPVVAGLFYLLPAVTGALCTRWQTALVLATLPAWFDLGVFAVAAAYRIGPFYLAEPAQAGATAGTLELFAALGILGWFARWQLQGLLRSFWSGEERMSEEDVSHENGKEHAHAAPPRDLVSSRE